MQELTDYYKEKYSDIVLYTMESNGHGNLPVYVAKKHNSNRTVCHHRHEPFQINYITRGNLCHEVNNSRYRLSKGSIFIIPPYIPHAMYAVDDEGYECVELEFVMDFVFDSSTLAAHTNTALFDFAFVEPFFVAEQDVRPRLLLTGSRQQTVEHFVSNIIREYEERTDGFLLAIKANLLNLLVVLGRYFDEETGRDKESIYRQQREEIRQTIEYIDSHCAEELTVENMAKISCLSRSYFSYLFKSITGKTLVEYVTDKRMERVVEMLGKTELSVTEICYRTGFHNINYFNRVFKKVYGISPTQYRKNLRSGQ